MKRKAKRNLLGELQEGFEALAAQRVNKLTLPQHELQYRSAPQIAADEIGKKGRSK